MNKQELIVSGPSQGKQESILPYPQIKIGYDFLFPTPREIDRQLYANVLLTIKNQAKISFRPLARQIGSYTTLDFASEEDTGLFPAPREVNRFFYNDAKQAGSVMTYLFPAPRKVNRRLYCNTHK